MTETFFFLINPAFSLSMHAISSILCHYGTRYSKCGSYRCQDCRRKIPQKLYQPCFVLLSHFSTDFHRLIQIFKYQRYFDYHRLLSIINNHTNQSLWLLICVNLCQSVVYKTIAQPLIAVGSLLYVRPSLHKSPCEYNKHFLHCSSIMPHCSSTPSPLNHWTYTGLTLEQHWTHHLPPPTYIHSHISHTLLPHLKALQRCNVAALHATSLNHRKHQYIFNNI